MDAQRALTAAEIASAVGALLVGDGGRLLRRVRALESAGPEDLAFVADSAAEKKAVESKAGALLSRSAAAFPGRTVLEVKDPSLALAAVLWLFQPRREAKPGVHSSAVVDPSASVDPSAEIGPFAVIGAGARIGAGVIVEAHTVVGARSLVGEGSWLHPHVVLYEGVDLGKRVEVHSGTVLGADGFGYATAPDGIRKIPQVGTVVIGDDVEIGANSCVDRATLEATRVGAGTKIDDLVMIGHNCEVGRHGFICSQTGLAGSTVMGDGVVLAGQVGVAGHLRIGNGVKVGAQSGLNTDVPDGASIFGSPAMPYRDALKSFVEIRRLPETARLVRDVAKKVGLEGETKP